MAALPFLSSIKTPINGMEPMNLSGRSICVHKISLLLVHVRSWARVNIIYSFYPPCKLGIDRFAHCKDVVIAAYLGGRNGLNDLHFRL